MVKLNEETDRYINEEYNRIIDKNTRILGVLCGSTDYVGAKGHPIQPQIEEVIRDCKVWMQKYNYEKIYLATECEYIYNHFAEVFPNRIIVNKRDYYDKKMQEGNVKRIGDVRFERDNDNYIRGLRYLSSLVILSRCDALLAGNCGGTLFSLFYNNRKYERFKIYDLGLQ